MMETDSEIGATEGELFGGLVTKDCSALHASLINEAWTIGKIVAYDAEFEQCILDSAYVPCDDDDDPRKSTAIAVSRSPNVSVATCKDLTNAGGETNAVHEAFHDEDEEFSINRGSLNGNASGTVKMRASAIASTLWHEVTHTHGFHHGFGSDTSKYAKQCGVDPSTWTWSQNSIPGIVGGCMRDTMRNLVISRFLRFFGRQPTSSEEAPFFQQMADGTITSGVGLTHAILSLAPPSNLRVDNIGGTTARLLWDDNSTTETHFVASGSTGSQSVPGDTSNENSPGEWLEDLTPATTYRFWVKACNAYGCSEKSNEVVFTTKNTLPPVPTSFGVTSTGTDRVTLGWQIPVSVNPRTSHMLTYTGTGISGWRTATIAANATSYVAPNLQPNTSYQFHLRACNDDGCSGSASTVGTTQLLAAIPAAPSNLRVTSSTSTTINLAWNDNAPLITNFNEQLHAELEYALATAGGGGPGGANLIWSKIVFAGRPTTYAFPVNVQTIHYFRVRACNIGGCSSPSNQVSRTP